LFIFYKIWFITQKIYYVCSYRKRFWHKEYFDGVADIQNALTACYGEGKVSLIEASVRWMYHHSKLSSEYGGQPLNGKPSLLYLICSSTAPKNKHRSG
jgi:hypothetical protein